MKLRRLAPPLLAALACTSTVALAPGAARAQVVTARNPRPPRPVTTFTLWGNATNVTANASTGVRFTMSTTDNVAYTVDGAFDNVNLYGRFDGAGRAVPCDGAVCVQFEGTVRLGGADGSGFPEGTRTRFVLSVSVSGPNAVGVYHIGRLEGMPVEQYGTLALAVRR